jgi:hypothetical protein
MRAAIIAVPAMIVMVGCITPFKVTLSQQTRVYSGTLNFDSPYTGDLSIPEGPDGESFSGRYVATDTTPAVSSVGGSGQIEAHGVWTGIGSKGSTIIAELKLGRGGHGVGVAKHSNGEQFQISF